KRGCDQAVVAFRQRRGDLVGHPPTRVGLLTLIHLVDRVLGQTTLGEFSLVVIQKRIERLEWFSERWGHIWHHRTLTRYARSIDNTRVFQVSVYTIASHTGISATKPYPSRICPFRNAATHTAIPMPKHRCVAITVITIISRSIGSSLRQRRFAPGPRME